ncbi:hypothetical protein NST83_18050 [Paenibacillus sp. FSL R10-2782]|uniref:hypothetical protein n=1 Tax=Paenibacillus sp. FSL R10-2782 TaxID=2954661 RepID=UPI0031587576
MDVDNDLVCCINIGKQVFPNTITRLMKRKVVSERLGHRSVTITLDTYSHLLKKMQSDAAVRLSNLLSKKEGSGPLEIEEKFCDQKRDQNVENVAV